MPTSDCDLNLLLENEPERDGVFRVRLRHWASHNIDGSAGCAPDIATDTCEPCEFPRLDQDYLEALREHVETPVSAGCLKELGHKLAQILLPPRVRSAVLAHSSARPDLTVPVRLRITAHPSELAALPWEYVWLDEPEAGGRRVGFLSLHPSFSIVRQVAAASPIGPSNRLIPSDRLLLLAAWSDPRSSRHPALPHREAELEVLNALGRFAENSTLHVRELAHATRASLSTYLADHPPHILHFIGHGDRRLSEGVLILEGGQQGLEESLRASELAEWLRGKPTRLVVLAACWTGTALNGIAHALVSSGMPAVVAMQMPFSDAAAGPFARAFYSALAQSCSVDEALRQARQMIKAAGADWGIPVLYTSGDLAPIIARSTPSAPVSIPYPRDPYFVGRERLLADLHRQLNEPGWRVVALVAMGGAGKTGTAVEYAHTHADDYPGGVFWLNAKDASTLIEEYASLSRFFDIPEDQPISARAIRVRDRLQSTTAPTLLVFDNMADEKVREFLPTRGACRVLISTREEWLVRNRAHVTFVPLLDEATALTILQVNRQIDPAAHPDEMEAMRDIAAMLGNLPLALALAAHVVDRLNLTFRQYQISLSTNRRKALESARRDFITATEHRGQIFDAIDMACYNLDPSASRVLETASCLGSGTFAYEILSRACSDMPPLDFAEAVATLRGQCLLTGELGGRMSMHELICLVVEGNVAEADRPVLMARTASSLADLLAEANFDMEWRSIRPDLPHFRAVAKACSELPAGMENAPFAAACADLYCQLGIYHFEHGELDEAENRLAESLRIIDAGGLPEEQEESRIPFVMRTWGEVKELQGDSINALACVRDALRMMQKQFGKCDPGLSDYYNSVGYVLKRRLQLRRAQPFYLRALAMSRQAHGERHADVAVCLNNMGGLFQAMGNLEQALIYFNDALEINREVFGLRHVKVAIRLNNIGRLQTALGRYDEAQVNHKEALEIYGEAYGQNHPDVAASMLLIADALKCADPEGSIPQIHEYAQQAEQILSRFYEAKHLHRVWARNLMAYQGANPPEVAPVE